MAASEEQFARFSDCKLPLWAMERGRGAREGRKSWHFGRAASRPLPLLGAVKREAYGVDDCRSSSPELHMSAFFSAVLFLLHRIGVMVRRARIEASRRIATGAKVTSCSSRRSPFSAVFRRFSRL